MRLLKMIPITLLLIVISAMTAQLAKAEILIEPSIGAPYGTWKSGRSTSTYDLVARGYAIGFGYGLRLAYGGKNFFVGLDYANLKLQWKYNKVASSSLDDSWRDADGTQTLLAPVIGFHTTDEKFAMWAKYFIQDRVTLSQDTDPQFTAPGYSGTGYAAGAGFQFFRHVKLNLEYQMHTFNKWNDQGSDVSLPGTASGLTQQPITYQVYYMSASFPFGFGHGKSE